MEGAGRGYGNEGGEKGEGELPTRKEAERIVAAHPEHMRGFLELLERELGGARGYFRQYCGFRDGELNGIVTNMTVERR